MAHSKPVTGQKAATLFNDLLFRRAGALPECNMASGNPSFKPFPHAITYLAETVQRGDNRLYATGAGYMWERNALLPFCRDMGLTQSCPNLDASNVIFGMGITHLYYTALNVLQHQFRDQYQGKKPVVLMSAPSYGLFTLQPESLGYDVETFPLRPENNWQIEPDIIAARIRDIEQDGTRKVCVFYNINPHNPTGTVTPAETTQALSKLLYHQGIMAFDDMAYYGLDYGHKPTPLGAHGFDNTVTFFSASKAFGMPRLRAGFATGPAWLMEEMDNHIGMQMISLPSITAPALAACFGTKHAGEATAYLNQNRAGYQDNKRLMSAFIHGIASVDVSPEQEAGFYKIVRETLGDKKRADHILQHGIPQLEIANADMQAGYFAMLRVRGLDNYFYGTTRLKNSFQFAAAVIDTARVITLPLSCSVTAAHPDMLRATFAGMSPRRIIRGLRGIVNTLESLPTQPNIHTQKELMAQGKALDHRFELLG